MRPIITYKNRDVAEQAANAISSSQAVATVDEHQNNEGASVFSISVDEPFESEALRTVEKNALTDSAITCPSCHSVNVEYPANPQASPTMKAVDKVVDAIGGNRREFTCRRCSYVWI